MSRTRDMGRAALEILGGWYEDGIEPEAVAAGLMTIDPSLLPTTDVGLIDDRLRAILSFARSGSPMTTPEGAAWLRAVIERGIQILVAARAYSAAEIEEPARPAPPPDRPIEMD